MFGPLLTAPIRSLCLRGVSGGRKLLAASALVFPLQVVLADVPEITTDQDRFQIPFDFDAARLAAVGAESVELYVARDGGRWELSETTSATERAFLYEADDEGTYSFCVRARKGDGGRIPDAPLAASLTVHVDQTAPALQMNTLSNPDGSVTVRWLASDKHIDLTSFAVEMRLPDGEWTPVNAKAAPSGSVDVVAGQGEEIRVRIADAANNRASLTKPLPQSVSRATTHLASANVPASIDSADEAVTATANAPITLASRTASVDVPDDAAASPLDAPQLPLAEAADSHVHEQGAWTEPTIAPGSAVAVPGQDAMQTASTQSTHAARTGHSTTASWAPSITKRVRTRTFRLGYELQDVGPSGLSTVALYITEDNGRTWFHYGNDPDATSPMDVTVPRDGVFGFSFRVMSGTGFGDMPPQPGERPDVSVAVDQTPPSIRMLDLGHRQGSNSHQLAIRWMASDASLPPRPIRVEYGSSPSGPWTPVAPPQPNSGEYVWDVTQPMVGAVYLRVSVTDAAGNTSSDFTREPIMLDFSRPAARITGIEAVAP